MWNIQMSLGFGTSFGWVLVLEQWSNAKKSASIMSSSRWFLRMSRIILYMASGITSHHNFTYSPILLPRQKKPIHQNWLSQNQTKINSFCNQTFHTSFFDAFVTIPHQECTKTVTSLIHEFCYQGKKRPIHRTWLSKNPNKINSFCKQTFHTSFFMHLWHFPTKIAQNP